MTDVIINVSDYSTINQKLNKQHSGRAENIAGERRYVDDFMKYYTDITNANNELTPIINNLNEKDKTYLSRLQSTIMKNFKKEIELYFLAVEDKLYPPYEDNINKRVDLANRQLEIAHFYVLKYKKEIIIIQILILFCGIGMLGCLLFHLNVFDLKLLSLYLGIVFAIAFVILFYKLWDLYIRDKNVFDEYNFGVYGSNPPTNVTPVNNNEFDKNELANLDC
jgi:hypothetical protein